MNLKRRRGSDGRSVAKHTKVVQPVPPASTRVGDVVELLESILLNLPMRDLLLYQRVCKSWQALITSSIRLRRALFLEPVACGAVSYIDWRLDDKDFYDDNRARLNLGEHLRGPDRDQRPKPYPAHWGQTREDYGKYRVFVNPLLAKMFPFVTGRDLYWNETIDDLPKLAQHMNASWRSMYFTQPPVNFMAIEWDSGDEDNDSDWTVSSVRKDYEDRGLDMEGLLGSLIAIGKAAWIEGCDHLETYEGVEDLAKVVRADAAEAA